MLHLNKVKMKVKRQIFCLFRTRTPVHGIYSIYPAIWRYDIKKKKESAIQLASFHSFLLRKDFRRSVSISPRVSLLGVVLFFI